MTEKMRGVLEMASAMVISGTIGLFVVLSGQPVTSVVFWRCVFGAAVLMPICAGMGFLRPGLISRRQAGLAVLGGVAIVTNWLLLFAAYPRASISIATAVYNTQPFMLVALGALVLSEKLTLNKLLWLVISFLGTLAIIYAKPGAGYSGENYVAGIVLALAAAFFYAMAAIIAKTLKGVPPQLIALIQVATGIFLLLPFSAHGPRIEAQAWTILLTLGVVHTGLMYILLYGAIQKMPTNLTGSLSFIYPVAAIIIDRIAFGHNLQPLQIAGVVAILVAAAGSTLGWSVVPHLKAKRDASERTSRSMCR
ncbi:DMT family transporter [uncultured Agrobacterium sp.]|uniref:DMT family transporter n=1 Tax=uncultured Agrobacterium sp. TaxID=157277 RepID=UPI0025E751B4|nr:DMT family transporter [uncultured Agrobacterium sp.]